MKIAVTYHVRSLFRRRGATALSTIAIGLSVAVLVIVLALARGFERSLAGTGHPDNVVVLRKGASSEGESGITRQKAQIIASLPGVERRADGKPLASYEMYAAVNMEKEGGGTSNIPFRGVSSAGVEVESTAELGEGRWFKQGTNEIVVGRGILGRVKGCRLGGAIEFNNKQWTVVGVIDAPTQAWHSEIWGDVELLLQEFDREGYNSVVLRLEPDTDRTELVERIEADQRLECKLQDQRDYFASQTGMLGVVLKFVGWFLALIMAIGSCFGAANTLMASLHGRRREIGSMLAIGFRPLAVYVGFLIEAALLGLMGGVLGVLIAFPINGVATGTTNWATFTEQAFAFQITGDVMLSAVLFGAFVGILGGTLPAWRASRLVPTEALRAL